MAADHACLAQQGDIWKCMHLKMHACRWFHLHDLTNIKPPDYCTMDLVIAPELLHCSVACNVRIAALS